MFSLLVSCDCIFLFLHLSTDSTYLFAVDAHTARYLYQNCLKGPLLAGRTVIIVTHAVGLVLPGAAYGVVLENGNVLAAGSPSELKSRNVFAADALADSGADDEHHDVKGTVEVPVEQIAAEQAGEADLDEARKIQDKKDSKKLVKDETTSTGGVSLGVYKLCKSSYSRYHLSLDVV
jgi:ABC-type multidrug transport system ATPase subunit